VEPGDGGHVQVLLGRASSVSLGPIDNDARKPSRQMSPPTAAIFRYRLFDIRLVFSRSVLYVLLTGMTVGAHLAIVAILGRLVTAQVPLGASVVATLVVAVAFNPVRVWLQRRVDSAAYGARRDPVRAMAEVSARLGEVGTVLTLIASGLNNAAIASRLGLAPNTVSNHISNIFGKLRVASRAEAIVRARAAGLGD
jgi:DNA-binding CsgD family transcriptional regulator